MNSFKNLARQVAVSVIIPIVCVLMVLGLGLEFFFLKKNGKLQFSSSQKPRDNREYLSD